MAGIFLPGPPLTRREILNDPLLTQKQRDEAIKNLNRAEFTEELFRSHFDHYVQQVAQVVQAGMDNGPNRDALLISVSHALADPAYGIPPEQADALYSELHRAMYELVGVESALYQLINGSSTDPGLAQMLEDAFNGDTEAQEALVDSNNKIPKDVINKFNSLVKQYGAKVAALKAALKKVLTALMQSFYSLHGYYPCNGLAQFWCETFAAEDHECPEGYEAECDFVSEDGNPWPPPEGGDDGGGGSGEGGGGGGGASAQAPEAAVQLPAPQPAEEEAGIEVSDEPKEEAPEGTRGGGEDGTSVGAASEHESVPTSGKEPPGTFTAPELTQGSSGGAGASRAGRGGTVEVPSGVALQSQPADGGGKTGPATGAPPPEDCTTCQCAVARVLREGQAKTPEGIERQIEYLWTAAYNTISYGRRLTDGLDRGADNRAQLAGTLFERCSGIVRLAPAETAARPGVALKPDSAPTPAPATGTSTGEDCTTCLCAVARVLREGQAKTPEEVERQIEYLWSAAYNTISHGRRLTDGIDKSSSNRAQLAGELFARCSAVARATPPPSVGLPLRPDGTPETPPGADPGSAGSGGGPPTHVSTLPRDYSDFNNEIDCEHAVRAASSIADPVARVDALLRISDNLAAESTNAPVDVEAADEKARAHLRTHPADADRYSRYLRDKLLILCRRRYYEKWPRTNEIKRDNSRFGFTNRGELVVVPTTERRKFVVSYLEDVTTALDTLCLWAISLRVPTSQLRDRSILDKLQEDGLLGHYNVELDKQIALNKLRAKLGRLLQRLIHVLCETSSDGQPKTIRDLTLAARKKAERLYDDGLTDKEINAILDEIDRLMFDATNLMELATDSLRALTAIFAFDHYRQGTVSTLVFGDRIQALVKVVEGADRLLDATLSDMPHQSTRSFHAWADTTINDAIEDIETALSFEEFSRYVMVFQGIGGLASLLRGGFSFILNSGVRLVPQAGGTVALTWEWATAVVSAEEMATAAATTAGGTVTGEDVARRSSEARPPNTKPPTPGPSGRVSFQKYAKKHVYRSTFASEDSSLLYHFWKHVTKRGIRMTLSEYVRRAEAVFNNPAARRSFGMTHTLKEAVKVEVEGVGVGLYLPDGRIVWFHPY